MRKTQCDRVLEFMERYGAITQEDCDLMVPKIKRLASRINDLKHEGHDIEAKMIKTPGGARVAEYSLKQTEQQLALGQWLTDADRLHDERKDDMMTNPEWFD